jgi:ferredoxin
VSDEQWRVAVDQDTCMGAGVCAGTAPDRFRLVGGRSSPVDEQVEPDQLLLDVAESCPTEAITVRDAAGRQLAPER